MRTKEEIINVAAQVYSKQGYIILGTSKQYKVGEIMMLTRNSPNAEDVAQPMKIIAVSNYTEYTGQFKDLDPQYGYTPDVAWLSSKYYFKCITD